MKTEYNEEIKRKKNSEKKNKKMNENRVYWRIKTKENFKILLEEFIIMAHEVNNDLADENSPPKKKKKKKSNKIRQTILLARKDFEIFFVFERNT